MSKAFNIIITGGKTGGHLFPGIAIAKALERLNPATNVLFVGTDAPFEVTTLQHYQYEHQSITSRPIKGRNILGKAVSVFFILISMFQAHGIIRRFKPGFVLGVGGFSSFSVVLTAWILRIPTGIQEQNTIPGITNRLLARYANIIFTSFKNTRGMPSNKPNVNYFGVPIRRHEAVVKNTEEPGTTHEAFPLKNDGQFTILVTGGSQGAQSINTAFLDALPLLENLKNLNIIHQTGKTDEAEIKSRYDRLDLDVNCAEFFHNMPELQDEADLVICRAGAGTLAEIAVKGLPCILVPYPHAADDHQTHNALALVNEGAAILIKDDELSGQILSRHITKLSKDWAKLTDMSSAIKKMAMPDADEKIAKEILSKKGISV